MTALLTLLSITSAGQPLLPHWNDGQLSVAAPNLAFIEGKSLDRLRNGQAVTFDSQLQLFDGIRPLSRTLQRFVLSYDLWEETYSAVQLSQTAPRTPVQSAARLKANAVAAWCLSRMRVPIPKVEPNRPLTLQLEIRTAGLKLPNPLRPQGSVDLGVLVEIFSRPPDPKESRFFSMTEPFTMGGLPRQ